ncbi:CDP-glycerol glycerophosphotransferase family protein [Rhizobacter sp. J219]|uniref:CDP-glycerol glycerophosphotransferase family protein n=1 Tax=Rhizobacter sp. J219 TaxID=2898430 RepID=UPI0021515770|nr:CDP-glycerol glycerophosphotransferase family protein [Rhizobacter sp. J219]MCR5885730.1 CDP-glycerol glycerophosphotransferase family protein [Rhizobacter sp. J219]
MVQALLDRQGLYLTYVSSTEADPGVGLRHPQLASLVIGDGHVRTLFFSSLQADLLLMTMPDLDSFHIKRSPRTRCYAYLHHSAVSSHMVYRPGAFDHFDVILCAGPHHEAEIRALEAKQGRPGKALLRHGYGRLDAILAESARAQRSLRPRPIVLVAPSWGAHGLLERHADALMRSLADTDWEVIVRPHPQTLRLAPHVIACVRQWCDRAANVRIDTAADSHSSLLDADLMVSDWSGAAFEFALGCERPVLFVDLPRKVNNPTYATLGIEPIEVFAREHLGHVLAESELADLPKHLATLHARQSDHRDAIRAFRDRWIYNVGHSADVGADSLIQLLNARLG